MTVSSAKKIALTSIKVSCGQRRPGVEKGPNHILASGIEKDLQSLGYQISSKEEIGECSREGKSNLAICSEVCQTIAQTVERHSSRGEFCLNLGGDHSIATGTIEGLLRTYPDLCVIWIDAHPDINTPASSESGNVHGMPMSFLIEDPRPKALAAFPKEYAWCEKKLRISSLAYIGIRDIDPPEAETITNLGICAYDIDAVQRLGIHECIHAAIRKVDPTLSRPIHVSFDIDALDPSLVPSTGTPVDGGLTLRELLTAAEIIHQTGRLVSLDVVELNPDKTDNPEDVKKTTAHSVQCLKAFLGNKRYAFA